MRVLGASLPVAALTLAALVLVLWAWAVSIRHGGTVRRMVRWLEANRSGDWAALPWPARRLFPQSGIAAMMRRGLANDPAFATLAAEARRLQRRSLGLILAGAACLAVLTAGLALFGWSAG